MVQQQEVASKTMTYKPSMIHERGRGRLLNVEQVRSRLLCSRQHVYNLINNGTLPATRIGKLRGVRIYESGVERLMEQPIE